MGEVSNQPTKANIHTSVWNVAELNLICDEKWHFFYKPELFAVPIAGSLSVKPYPTYTRPADKEKHATVQTWQLKTIQNKAITKSL